jgi:hypothetical protein
VPACRPPTALGATFDLLDEPAQFPYLSLRVFDYDTCMRQAGEVALELLETTFQETSCGVQLLLQLRALGC